MDIDTRSKLNRNLLEGERFFFLIPLKKQEEKEVKEREEVRD